jgi:FkbM family methyltransferase
MHNKRHFNLCNSFRKRLINTDLLKNLIIFIKLFKNYPSALLTYFSVYKSNKILKLKSGECFEVRKGKSDIQMIIELYEGKSYHHFINSLKSNSTIIDIGSNIGTFSVFIAALLKGNANIFSYEPYIENYNLLKENIRLNGYENVISAFPLAVANEAGERSFYIDKDDNAMHSFFYETVNLLKVKTITLNEIFSENKIDKCDFLKIDAEGSEYEIILNSSDEIFGRIKIISLEFHKHKEHTYEELKKFLEAKEFNVNVTLSKIDGFGFIDAAKK